MELLKEYERISELFLNFINRSVWCELLKHWVRWALSPLIKARQRFWNVRSVFTCGKNVLEKNKTKLLFISVNAITIDVCWSLRIRTICLLCNYDCHGTLNKCLCMIKGSLFAILAIKQWTLNKSHVHLWNLNLTF